MQSLAQETLFSEEPQRPSPHLSEKIAREVVARTPVSSAISKESASGLKGSMTGIVNFVSMKGFPEMSSAGRLINGRGSWTDSMIVLSLVRRFAVKCPFVVLMPGFTGIVLGGLSEISPLSYSKFT